MPYITRFLWLTWLLVCVCVLMSRPYWLLLRCGSWLWFSELSLLSFGEIVFIPPAEFWPKKVLDLLLWKYSKPLHMELRFFHAPASSSVPLFLSLSHHLFHLLSHVIISPLQTSYPCLQSVPSHPGNCPFLKMRLNLANSASIGWPVAQPPRRWGTLLCKSRSYPTATGKPTQLTSCITWPPGLLTGTRTHAHTHSCSGWYITLWICGTSYIDSLKCNILFFYYTFHTKNSKEKVIFLTVSHNCKCQHDWLLAKLQCLSLIRRKWQSAATKNITLLSLISKTGMTCLRQLLFLEGYQNPCVTTE